MLIEPIGGEVVQSDHHETVDADVVVKFGVLAYITDMATHGRYVNAIAKLDGNLIHNGAFVGLRGNKEYFDMLDAKIAAL